MLRLPESPRLPVESDEVSLEPLLQLIVTTLNQTRRESAHWLRDGLAQLAEDGLTLRVATRPVRRQARRSLKPYAVLLNQWAAQLHRSAELFVAECVHESRRAWGDLAPMLGQLLSLSFAGWVMVVAASLRTAQRIRTWPTSALLAVVIVADFVIAAAFGLPVVSKSPNIRAVLHSAPKHAVPLYTDWLPAYSAVAPPGAESQSIPSRRRSEIAPAAALPEVMMTATPIPSVSTAWLATLPLEPAWEGAGRCDGQWYVAPTGGGSFAWPGDSHYLSGRDFYSAWHPGIDIAAQLGDPLYVADSGVVVYAGWNTQGYGNLIILDHGNGWHTLYAHLSQFNVSCGDPVWQGQIIGYAGSTGNSTGPHLHFEIRGPGGRVNPWEYLP
ncbi:MAG: M23 family metallopeptidase [Anaerolineales bacterium]